MALYKQWVNKLKGRLYRIGRFGERDKLTKIEVDNPKRPRILSYPSVDWNHHLFQRPQQIAINLAKFGYLFFYCTENCGYDHVWGYTKLANGLYLTNRFDRLVKNGEVHILYLFSTNIKVDWTFIENELKRGNLVLYDFIDEIDQAISGVPIPPQVYERHENILKDERCIVIATADKLYQDVLRQRSKNCALVSNGVDFEHFSQVFSADELPDEFAKLVSSKRPIIGFYGALASWFDYELVMALAAARPEYEIVLIGWDYDRSIKTYPLGNHPNIHVMGPIPYQDLPCYASWFAVSMIPFRLNEITRSTSPIKLFEYMALGHPIVTTDMPECRKYRSVLIGDGTAGFIDQIDRALSLHDDASYTALLRQEALENTWEVKARVIADLLNANLMKKSDGT